MLRHGFIVFLSLTLASCTFSPDKEYINPIEPPPPISVTIEVNDLNFSDPYYLIRPTQFVFTLKDLTKPVVGYEVTVDNTNNVGSGTTGNVSFYLYPWTLGDGVHTVKMQIKVATQSGSLAERLGGEFYLIEKSFVVVVDRNPPPAVSPTASYENGALTVRWNATSQKNFVYVIKRTYSPYLPLRDSIVTNTSQNFFVDKGFVGGEITYKIAATGFGFEQKELGTVTFKSTPVDFKVTLDDKRVARLSWTQSLVDVQNVTVKISGAGRTVSVPLASSGNMVIDTLAMAEQMTYWVETVKSGYPMQMYRHIEGLTTVPNLKPFLYHAFLPKNNRLLISTAKAIYRYRLPDMVLEDSLTAAELSWGDFSNFVVSEDEGKGVVVAGSANIFGFDPMTFDSPVMYGIFKATWPVTGGTDEIRNIILGTLTNNGYLSTVISKNGNRYPVVYDINENLVRWYGPSFQYLNAVRPPTLSKDAGYLIYDVPATTKGEVYKRDADNYLLSGLVSPGIKYFRQNTNELISAGIKDEYSQIASLDVNVYDISNPPAQSNQFYPVVRTKKYPSIVPDSYLWQLNYDPTTDTFYSRYMWNAMSIITLFDVTTFTETGSMRAFTYTPYSHDYFNNYHITNRGFIEKVK